MLLSLPALRAYGRRRAALETETTR
jgi:hypothetical protein